MRRIFSKELVATPRRFPPASHRALLIIESCGPRALMTVSVDEFPDLVQMPTNTIPATLVEGSEEMQVG